MTTYKFWVLLFINNSSTQNYFFKVEAVTEPVAYVLLWEHLLPLLSTTQLINRVVINNCSIVKTGCCNEEPLEDCVGLPIRN